MAEPNARLLRAMSDLRPVLECVRPRLIGGLAVHLRCAKRIADEDLDPDLLTSYDPRRWPMVVRATRDIDLVIEEPRMDTARQALLAGDFERSEAMTPPPERYVRKRSVVVDLIACADVGDPAGRPGLQEAVVALRAEQGEVAGWSTATTSALVVYKALALRERDLIDVARIALLDRHHGEARSGVARLRQRLRPAFGRALRELEERFANSGGNACGAFFREVEAALGYDVEGLEDPIREQTSAAVRELLRNS